MNNKKFVLVIGSKPDSKLPNIAVEKVYSANGAAERAQKYFGIYGRKSFTAVCGSLEFFKNEHVKERVLRANPNLIFFRSGKVLEKNFSQFSDKLNFVSKSRNEQILFQAKYVKYGLLSIILAELTHEEGLINNIKHLRKIFKQNGMLGVNTGFFSILLANYENPDSYIVCSGIGIKTVGKSFHPSLGTSKRAVIDKKIYKYLNLDIKNKLMTTDKEMSEFCNIPLIKEVI